MSLMDKIKNLVNAKPLETPRLTMRVCMLGARGVGKTSVITSMFYGQKEAVSGTNLFLTAENSSTAPLLNAKKQELTSMFDGVHPADSLVTQSGLAGDSTETLFRFTYGMSSENVNIDLEIRDYPGEYLVKEPEQVAAFIQQADAVLVAIDTPCLMEQDGRYHDGKNKPALVTDFLKEHLSGDGDKLVLLVPLKCEKYCRERTINDVTARIQESYAELIAFLKERRNSEGKRNTCCAITPIQTLGGIAFHSFGADETGETEYTLPGGELLPARMNYHYIATDAVFAPVHCEQPLYYLLAFVSKQYAKANEEQKAVGFWAKLREMLRLIPHIDEFINEISILGIRRIEDRDGYKILFGRGRI